MFGANYFGAPYFGQASFGEISQAGAAELVGTSTLTASASLIAYATAAISGDSELFADARQRVRAAAALYGDSTLSAEARQRVRAQAALSGDSTLAALAYYQMRAAASLSGDAILAVDSFVVPVDHRVVPVASIRPVVAVGSQSSDTPRGYGARPTVIVGSIAKQAVSGGRDSHTARGR